MFRSRVAPLFGLFAGNGPWPRRSRRPRPPLTLTEKDAGQTVTLKLGDTLVLNLRNPASGGYTVLAPAFNDKILTFMYRQDRAPEKARPGDFGRLEFAWQARQAGDTEVTVKIARPWETNKPPEQFMKIRVRVEN